MMSSRRFEKVTIIGAGSFGTAIAHHLAQRPSEKLGSVILYGRNAEVVASINQTHRNPLHSSEFELHADLKATDELGKAIENTELIIFATPTSSIAGIANALQPLIDSNVVAINLAKGLDASSLTPISEVLRPIFKRRQAVLSGPSFADDVFNQFPVGLTLGCQDRALARRLAELFTTPTFDVKVSTDLAGVEIGGALKNVFALVAGLIEGVGAGASVKGDFIARAMVEMRDIGLFLGGRWSTFSGRSGLGDLVTTCSAHSRNHRYGVAWSDAWVKNDGTEEKERREAADEAGRKASGSKTIESLSTLEVVHTIVDRAKMHTPIVHAGWRVLVEGSLDVHQLVREIRRLDLLRLREGSSPLQILMHSLFPRRVFRRRYSSKKHNR